MDRVKVWYDRTDMDERVTSDVKTMTTLRLVLYKHRDTFIVLQKINVLQQQRIAHMHKCTDKAFQLHYKTM